MSPETDVQQKCNKVREHSALSWLGKFSERLQLLNECRIARALKETRQSPTKKQIICDLMLGSSISYTSPVTIDEGKGK